MMHAPYWAQWLQTCKASLHSKPCTQAALLVVMVYLVWQVCSHMVSALWSLLVQPLIVFHLHGNNAKSYFMKAKQWTACFQAKSGCTIQAVKFREHICIPGLGRTINSWAIRVLRALRIPFVLYCEHSSHPDYSHCCTWDSIEHKTACCQTKINMFCVHKHAANLAWTPVSLVHKLSMNCISTRSACRAWLCSDWWYMLGATQAWLLICLTLGIWPQCKQSCMRLFGNPTANSVHSKLTNCMYSRNHAVNVQRDHGSDVTGVIA